MVVFHRISAVDRMKLPNIDNYKCKLPLLAQAFNIQEFDTSKPSVDGVGHDLENYLTAMRSQHGLMPIGGCPHRLQTNLPSEYYFSDEAKPDPE